MSSEEKISFEQFYAAQRHLLVNDKRGGIDMSPGSQSFWDIMRLYNGLAIAFPERFSNVVKMDGPSIDHARVYENPFPDVWDDVHTQMEEASAEAEREQERARIGLMNQQERNAERERQAQAEAQMQQQQVMQPGVGGFAESHEASPVDLPPEGELPEGQLATEGAMPPADPEEAAPVEAEPTATEPTEPETPKAPARGKGKARGRGKAATTTA